MQQETLSKKEKNMLKAAHLRYVDDMNHQQIAKDLGLSPSTISNYFSSDEMEKFERFYSEEEKRYMKVKLKEKIDQNTKIASNLVGSAAKSGDAKPSDKIRAAGVIQDIPKNYIEMMQELGIIDKPKERKEVKQTNVDSSSDKLAELYKEKMEGEQENE